MYDIKMPSLHRLLRSVLAEIVRKSIYARDTVRMYELPSGVTPTVVPVPAIATDFREIHGDDLRQVCARYSEFAPADWLSDGLQRFAKGHRCWGLISGGLAVSLVWSASGGRVPITEVEQSITVEPDMVYFYAAGTLAAYRGNGLYPYLLQCLCGVFSDKRKLIGTKINNRPSVRGIEKAGFQPHHHYHRVRILGMRLIGRRQVAQ